MHHLGQRFPGATCTPGPWPRLATLVVVVVVLIVLVRSGYTPDIVLRTLAGACAIAAASAAHLPARLGHRTSPARRTS